MVSYKDGNSIPQVTDPTQRESLTTGAWAITIILFSFASKINS